MGPPAIVGAADVAPASSPTAPRISQTSAAASTEAAASADLEVLPVASSPEPKPEAEVEIVENFKKEVANVEDMNPLDILLATDVGMQSSASKPPLGQVANGRLSGQPAQTAALEVPDLATDTDMLTAISEGKVKLDVKNERM